MSILVIVYILYMYIYIYTSALFIYAWSLLILISSLPCTDRPTAPEIEPKRLDSHRDFRGFHAPPDV